MRRIGTPFESVLPASVIPDTGVRGHYGAVPPAPRSARPLRSTRPCRPRTSRSRARPGACDHGRVDAVRIDRWLWAARFFKTRGAATDAVLGGKAHVNGVRVKPSKDVRAGDRLEVTIGDVRREVVVRAVADKRGPASVAATLYEETPESIARREQHAAARHLARPLGADLGGRPTKRDRRRLDALRRAERNRRSP